jgi:tetratricopeptide (TPR) repeat protein
MVVAILFLFSGNRMNARDWVKLTSARGEVFSNAGTAPARRALEQFDWMANAFQSYGNPRKAIPLRVLIFASEREFAAYRPSEISAGFYQSGPDGDWIVFHSAVGERVALHEYTHRLLNRSLTRLPQWLEEGMAEFFSTLRIDKQGKILIGAPIPSHLENLKFSGLLPARELLAGSKNSIHYSENTAAGRFYATSWALVHMLYLSPRYAARMPQFVEAIDAAAVPPETAFEQSFGISVAKALQELAAYLERPTLPSGTVALDPADGRATISNPEPASIAEITQLQAELLLDSGHPQQAAAMYRKLARSNTARQNLTWQAYWALSQGDIPAASNFFERILEDPQAGGRAVFEYAMLLREHGGSRARVTQLLERAVARNPSHPEAHFLLGVRATDEKRYRDAVDHLREAVAILPRQANFWHALGFAYSRLGNLPEARKAALKAVRIAETEQEEKMASDLLAGLDRPAAPGSSRAGDAPVPESWKNPQGDSTFTGELREFVCGDPPRVRLATAQGDMEEFVILNPKKLALRNASGAQREFQCGTLDPTRVRIEYFGATRDITSIDFTP